MSSKTKVLPYIALVTGILALGFSALFVRWANVPGPVMGFYRLGLATLILTPFALQRRKRAGFLKPAVLIFPVVGGLMTSLDHAIWNTSIQYTTAANATLLNNATPIWVALFAWLVFRERLRSLFWLGLVLTLSGAVAVLGSDFIHHPSVGVGDLLAILSSLFYAGYFLVTQRGREKLDTLSYIWIVGIVASLALFAMSVTLGMPLRGFSPNTYLAFLGAALISQLGGYLSVGYALGHLPASIVSPTMIGQPVVTAVLAFLLLGEKLLPAQWGGGLVVLAGIYLVHRSRMGKTVPAAQLLVPPSPEENPAVRPIETDTL
jgi:drug/metabolite transporter (DMT)-like permease